MTLGIKYNSLNLHVDHDLPDSILIDKLQLLDFSYKFCCAKLIFLNKELKIYHKIFLI